MHICIHTIRHTFLFTSLHFCFSIAGGIDISAYHDIKLRARGHNSEVFTKSHFMNCPTLFLPICLFIPPSVQNRRGNNTTAPLDWMESLQTQGEFFLKNLIHGISQPVCLRKKLKLIHRQFQLLHQATRPSTSSVFAGNHIQGVILSKREQKN